MSPSGTSVARPDAGDCRPEVVGSIAGEARPEAAVGEPALPGSWPATGKGGGEERPDVVSCIVSTVGRDIRPDSRPTGDFPPAICSNARGDARPKAGEMRPAASCARGDRPKGGETRPGSCMRGDVWPLVGDEPPSCSWMRGDAWPKLDDVRPSFSCMRGDVWPKAGDERPSCSCMRGDAWLNVDDVRPSFSCMRGEAWPMLDVRLIFSCDRGGPKVIEMRPKCSSVRGD